MNEYYFDELLHIETIEEQDGFHESFHYHRYEPTPYWALQQLFDQYNVKATDHIVDFGCGKGRLNFYIHHFFGASVTGVEMSEQFYKEALLNKQNYLKHNKKNKGTIGFHCCLAQEYQINPLDTIFYFFNPFSIQIFMKIVNNILCSVEEHPRKVEIVLYYPSEDYLYFLENQTAFEWTKEVVLSKKDARERFIVFQMAY
ncbi:MAG: class I SAM-dependent methyltransferase [Bacillaceae bacterium]